jgi:hypothetical protein
VRELLGLGLEVGKVKHGGSSHPAVVRDLRNESVISPRAPLERV